MKPYLLYILSILQAVSVFGQTPTNREKFRIPVTQITEHLDIDGALNEAIWKQNVRAENFYRVLPIDTGFASAKTEVMVAYDHDNLYLGITCYDSLPGKRPVESLRRDFVFGKNDNFIVFMDTYNDQTNGFAFGVSAAGAQWDGIQANGGAVSLDWDIKWKSAVKN